MSSARETGAVRRFVEDEAAREGATGVCDDVVAELQRMDRAFTRRLVSGAESRLGGALAHARESSSRRFAWRARGVSRPQGFSSQSAFRARRSAARLCA
jgi:hypothetical protein